MKDYWKHIRNTKAIKIIKTLYYFILLSVFIYSAGLDYSLQEYTWFILDIMCAITSYLWFNDAWNKLFND